MSVVFLKRTIHSLSTLVLFRDFSFFVIILLLVDIQEEEQGKRRFVVGLIERTTDISYSNVLDSPATHRHHCRLLVDDPRNPPPRSCCRPRRPSPRLLRSRRLFLLIVLMGLPTPQSRALEL